MNIPGYGQRFIQFLTGKKNPPLNLKAELQKLIFTDDQPQVICENSGIFTMVMSTFMNYEKNVSIVLSKSW